MASSPPAVRHNLHNASPGDAPGGLATRAVATPILLPPRRRTTPAAVRRGDRERVAGAAWEARGGGAGGGGARRWRDIVERHDQLVRRELGRHRGREVKTMGDGFLATFDGPARAIRCAVSARDAIRTLGIEIRAGLHTGE